MSKYTMELRQVCDIMKREEVESWFKEYELTDFLTTEQIKVVTDTNIWNKDTLAKKIVDHYFMREIGFETIALFKHYAKITMYEIMEKYVPIIYSSSIIYNPLINVDFTETYNRTINDKTDNSGSSTSTSSGNGTGLQVNSDTPQGQISKDEILSGKYASSTVANDSNTSANENINSNSTENKDTIENFSKTTVGNSGVSATNQKMIQQYRDNIITINKNIIDELNILFMGLY